VREGGRRCRGGEAVVVWCLGSLRVDVSDGSRRRRFIAIEGDRGRSRRVDSDDVRLDWLNFRVNINVLDSSVLLVRLVAVDRRGIPTHPVVTREDITTLLVESCLRLSLRCLPVRSGLVLLLSLDLRRHRKEDVVELGNVGRIVRIDGRNEGRDVALVIDVLPADSGEVLVLLDASVGHAEERVALEHAAKEGLRIVVEDPWVIEQEVVVKDSAIHWSSG
jgi:hypothetical protein